MIVFISSGAGAVESVAESSYELEESVGSVGSVVGESSSSFDMGASGGVARGAPGPASPPFLPLSADLLLETRSRLRTAVPMNPMATRKRN